MKVLAAQPKLVEQVHDAIVSEIASGKLKPGERVIQEQIAQELGVSRQPVQQALLLLRKQGVLRDAPGRGLIVASLDVDQVANMYDIRAVMEGPRLPQGGRAQRRTGEEAGPGADPERPQGGRRRLGRGDDRRRSQVPRLHLRASRRTR